MKYIKYLILPILFTPICSYAQNNYEIGKCIGLVNSAFSNKKISISDITIGKKVYMKYSENVAEIVQKKFLPCNPKTKQELDSCISQLKTKDRETITGYIDGTQSAEIAPVGDGTPGHIKPLINRTCYFADTSLDK